MREWSIITSKNHPRNPQQPTHSLLSTWLDKLKNPLIIDLDDGKIETGKPFFLMVKTHGFPVDFPNKTNPVKQLLIINHPSLITINHY